jgi:hypothetical protein
MRCTTCNKFRGQDTSNEPEVDLDVDDEGVVIGTVRVVNSCDDCGEEMRGADFDVEIDLSDAVTAHEGACHRGGEDFGLTIESEDVERTERRFRGRQYYGFSLSVTVKCSCNRELNDDGHAVPGSTEFEGSAESDVAASDMEELM